MEQILDYEILPIGRSKNYSNKIFGDYKVLYKTFNPANKDKTQTFWLCQCINCQQYTIKNSSILKNGVNKCNCQHDLVGKIFGRWTVIEKSDEKTKNGKPKWHCRCICGNEKIVDGYTLRSGQSNSCGCLHLELLKSNGEKFRKDITGQRFGKLVALYPIYPKDKNKHTKWHCKCDCGNETDVDLGNLTQGFTKSCGCTISFQEENIIKLLQQSNKKFKYQHKFENFPSKKFDFFIEDKYIIEYDGQQHFYYTGNHWDTKEHFERTRRSDLEKNQYCFLNNIPIIRIPYYANYTLQDLILETSRFILTPETEKRYYNEVYI